METETINSLFPIRMGLHIFLGLMALLVFGLQFIRYRKSHHLVLAIAFPCTLIPYLSDSMTLFYVVGVAEFIAMFLSFILSFTVDKPKPGSSSDSHEEGTS